MFKFALVGEVLGACTECSVVGNLLESVANLCVFIGGEVWAEGELVVWIWVEPGVVFVLASSFGVCVEELCILGAGGLVVGTPVVVELMDAGYRVFVSVWVFVFWCLSEFLDQCCLFSESFGDPDAAFCLLASKLLLSAVFGFPLC